ncbi:DUF4010 domain-containing protein [Patescibacteria group bacterium]|nr:DUF4010 domain-containing protein [Patescibacteria group bacterium]MBU1703168.1 DUF4010 domain-containing protein [Patescibacteria group bacterium]MBU1954315.1 DUF4010 domain-containing protein [Patescibacteria group bacterium]
MDLQNIVIPFAASILIGALIGIEREKKKQSVKNLSAVGIRSSIVISLFGATSAYLGQLLSPVILMVSLAAIITLTIASYIYLVTKYGRIGITTEISTILLFLYGAICVLGSVQLAIILGILTTLVLSLKSYLHGVAKNVSDREFYDTIKFAIIAFIILPFLPDKNFDQTILGPLLSAAPQSAVAGLDVLNPYRIWFLVVFVSGVSYTGYILVKLFGNKVGLSLSGLMGGLYSSTATSLTLAQRSKEMLKIKTPFIAAITLACAISYIKSFIFIRALNEELFLRTLIPLGLMFLYMLCIGLYLMLSTKKEKFTAQQELKTPFTLIKALKLGAFIIGALLVAKISLSYAKVEIYYIVATISALFAIDDPIVISTSASAGNLLSMFDAKNIILLVTYLNMIQKVFIVYFFGNRKLVKPTALIFGGLLLVTLVGFIYL